MTANAGVIGQWKYGQIKARIYFCKVRPLFKGNMPGLVHAPMKQSINLLK